MNVEITFQVRLERIQFVGACNPPTDPGRKPLSHRFLRHVPVVYVDYPGETSLKQVLETASIMIIIWRNAVLTNSGVWFRFTEHSTEQC